MKKRWNIILVHSLSRPCFNCKTMNEKVAATIIQEYLLKREEKVMSVQYLKCIALGPGLKWNPKLG